MVVATLPPGCCARVSLFQSGKGASIESVPDRTPSSALSIRVVP